MDRHIPQYSASSNPTWSDNDRLGHGDCNTVTSRSAVLFDVKLSNHPAPAFDTVFVRFRFPRRNAANQEIHLMMPGSWSAAQSSDTFPLRLTTPESVEDRDAPR